MEFSASRPDVVRAINHRWLLKFWKRHLGELRAPRWQAIEAADLSAISSHLLFLDVIGGSDTARFQIRFQGATIMQVTGSTNYRGRFLDEVMPATRHAESLPPYRHATLGHPVYTIQDINDRNGRQVHFERLLLPFAADGQTVDRILASFELFCEDGAFESRNLMPADGKAPALRLAVTIDPATLA